MERNYYVVSKWDDSIESDIVLAILDVPQSATRKDVANYCRMTFGECTILETKIHVLDLRVVDALVLRE